MPSEYNSSYVPVTYACRQSLNQGAEDPDSKKHRANWWDQRQSLEESLNDILTRLSVMLSNFENMLGVT